MKVREHENKGGKKHGLKSRKHNRVKTKFRFRQNEPKCLDHHLISERKYKIVSYRDWCLSSLHAMLLDSCLINDYRPDHHPKIDIHAYFLGVIGCNLVMPFCKSLRCIFKSQMNVSKSTTIGCIEKRRYCVHIHVQMVKGNFANTTWEHELF